MRQISIDSGTAFLLVFSVDNSDSLDTVKTRLDQIKQQRADDFEVGRADLKLLESNVPIILQIFELQ